MTTATKTQAEDDTEEDAAASRTPFEVEMSFFCHPKTKNEAYTFLGPSFAPFWGFFLLFRSLDLKLDGRMGHGTLSNHYCVAHTIR